jgi:hypothetical protein
MLRPALRLRRSVKRPVSRLTLVSSHTRPRNHIRSPRILACHSNRDSRRPLDSRSHTCRVNLSPMYLASRSRMYPASLIPVSR